jgi:hypothetical protein
MCLQRQQCRPLRRLHDALWLCPSPPMGYRQVEEAKPARRQTSLCHPARSTLGECDYYYIISTLTLSTATDLVRWARGGVLRNWTGRVRRHVLKDPAQPVDDVVIVNLAVGHQR